MLKIISSDKFTKTLSISSAAVAVLAYIGLLIAPFLPVLYSGIKFFPYAELFILALVYLRLYIPLLIDKNKPIHIIVLRTLSFLGTTILGGSLEVEITRYASFFFEALSMFKNPVIYLLGCSFSQFILSFQIVVFLLMSTSAIFIKKIEEHPVINYTKIILLCTVLFSSISYAALTA